MVCLTSHGTRELVVGSLLLAVVAAALAWVWWPAALLVIPPWVFLFAFFRDPERAIPTDPNVMVSPADGTVSDITPIDNDPLLGAPAVRVGIFLSVFNVHINRAPCDGKITHVIYKTGRFINALHHNQASEHNESNTLVIAEPEGARPIAVVKQIVGLIARRIICTPVVGEGVQRGQRIGMIKFGSRTELVIPQWLGPRVVVAVGQKVRGGLDVIATLGQEAQSPPTGRPADAGARS